MVTMKERINKKNGPPFKEIKKEIKRTVRFNLEEDEFIKKNSEMLKIKQSTYIRRCVTSRSPIYKISEEERQFIRDLCGQSRNLNQLTHLAHIHGITSILQEFIEYRNKINIIIEKISS